MTNVWKRARTDAQKAQRRATLLDAAARMFRDQPLESISLNAIAREANVSKASVYRYFGSREELFLQLTLGEFEGWREALTTRLDRLEGRGDAATIAAALVEATIEHETFARLASMLTTVLERNVTTEAVYAFKMEMMGGVAGMLGALGRALPDLSDEQVMDLIQHAYMQIVALWPASHPPPEVRAALERPELSMACVHFEPRLTRSIEVYLRGLRAESNER